MAKRLAWIDLAKGIGVMLMVVGHMPSMPSVIHEPGVRTFSWTGYATIPRLCRYSVSA